jgi:hypothetical protein
VSGSRTTETDDADGSGIGTGPQAKPPGGFAVGSAVRLTSSVPYLKTADPMPMLRPPDLVDPGETGVVAECRALGILAVRFRRGTFLLEESRLSPLSPEEPDPC